jgi:branched-chain amino acid transport system ATP-binding protein
MSFLVVEGLQKSFGGVRAVAGVSFELARGELLALIGPNGAGKSTCFNMLYGLLAPDAGAVRLDGRDITAMRPRDIWRLGVGRTFQITATFSSMTVAENVQMALISHAGMSFSVIGRARTMTRARALELLDLAGMADQADRAASVLAYGDLKRLELAIALAHEPGLLLMDEPTAGMAPAERGALMELVGAIVRERHMATLFTEHDMDIVFGHADRVLVLNRGELIAEGPPERIRADPRVIEVYLGGGHA